MAFKLLEPDEKPEVFYHSSISQHKNKLSVRRGGEWLPISYDVIDYIDCDKVVSHRAVVTDSPDIGYDFSVGEKHFYSDIFLTGDKIGIEKVPLSPWFGEGCYERYVSSRVLLKADCEPLSIHNKEKLRVGYNYALAVKTLPAED